MAITFDQMQVLTKTELGRRTIRDRSIELPRAARTILVLVDGRSTVEKLQKFISATQASERTLEDLAAKGLITHVAPDAVSEAASREAMESTQVAQAATVPMDDIERFNALYELMCEVSATFLGLRGYFVQLNIEKSANSAELLKLRPALVESIAKRHGNEIAKDISRRIRELT